MAKLGSDGVSESDIIAESSYADFYGRSVSVELEMLEKGDYIVLTRIDSTPNLDKVIINSYSIPWNVQLSTSTGSYRIILKTV